MKTTEYRTAFTQRLCEFINQETAVPVREDGPLQKENIEKILGLLTKAEIFAFHITDSLKESIRVKQAQLVGYQGFSVADKVNFVSSVKVLIRGVIKLSGYKLRILPYRVIFIFLIFLAF